MGFIRKVTSLSSLGLVDFRSDKERTAAYTHSAARSAQTTNALLAQQNRLLAQGAQSPSMGPPSMAPAGWYPDPAGGDALRHWNGGAWAAVAGEVAQGVGTTEAGPDRYVPPRWLVILGVVALMSVLGAVLSLAGGDHSAQRALPETTPTTITAVAPDLAVMAASYGPNGDLQPGVLTGILVINNTVEIRTKLYPKASNAFNAAGICNLAIIAGGAKGSVEVFSPGGQLIAYGPVEPYGCRSTL